MHLPLAAQLSVKCNCKTVRFVLYPGNQPETFRVAVNRKFSIIKIQSSRSVIVIFYVASAASAAAPSAAGAAASTGAAVITVVPGTVTTRSVSMICVRRMVICGLSSSFTSR